jgi:hypothetical protein
MLLDGMSAAASLNGVHTHVLHVAYGCIFLTVLSNIAREARGRTIIAAITRGLRKDFDLDASFGGFKILACFIRSLLFALNMFCDSFCAGASSDAQRRTVAASAD